LDLSQITVFEDLSIIREQVILDEMDKQGRLKKYEMQMRLWLVEPDEEDLKRAFNCYNLINSVARPWEELVEQKKLKYTGDDLMKLYPDMFPDEIKQE